MSDPLRLCLVLVLREVDGRRQVLLGEKRRGFGTGRVVAPGGKIDAGESPAQAAVRELEEETGLLAQQVEGVGVITFRFAGHPNDDRIAHVFRTVEVTGQVTPSDELSATWIDTAAVPYQRMWADSRHWLPFAMDGALGAPEFVYAPDRVTLARIRGLPDRLRA